MLFIPPDRLHRPSFKQLMQELQVSFFAINYSYCQPKWELSFQRQFLQTLRFARKHGVGDVRYLGSPVQSTKPEDLQEGIESEADNTALISSLPEGLHLETCTVRYAEHKWERLQMLLEECKGKVGKVLICADTRAQCIETSHYLGAHNIEARAYHSGVSDTEREETKCWFEESSNGVLCTTIPHGAGIDYTTIQYVIQFHTALQGGEKGFERPGFCAVSIKRVKRII
ncbi:hypothetical protein FRC03_010983 [Tulasnella sp. 419]|nr:hypothetical protein FRC03_010983 [Tulasnella sp. 419]